MYAKDIVMFCEAVAEEICYIKMILLILEANFGLSVNGRKSSLFSIKEVAHIEELVGVLGCKLTQYLSLGGKLTLINAVLDSLPTYVMFLFPIPISVVKKLAG
ncbi:hypothetical protein H5410_042066 [Solanum commersonii]|uniref:Reverse transcriptase domain-containing protein n=1 Tax=Solanum commersonii TaxID=4109 RepID=A0A9J5XWG5_SOLCO|nr:hypothetical protein H5410_042066 [Solanum commersonii]